MPYSVCWTRNENFKFSNIRSDPKSKIQKIRVFLLNFSVFDKCDASPYSKAVKAPKKHLQSVYIPLGEFYVLCSGLKRLMMSTKKKNSCFLLFLFFFIFEYPNIRKLEIFTPCPI